MHAQAQSTFYELCIHTTHMLFYINQENSIRILCAETPYLKTSLSSMQYLIVIDLIFFSPCFNIVHIFIGYVASNPHKGDQLVGQLWAWFGLIIIMILKRFVILNNNRIFYILVSRGGIVSRI